MPNTSYFSDFKEKNPVPAERGRRKEKSQLWSPTGTQDVTPAKV